MSKTLEKKDWIILACLVLAALGFLFFYSQYTSPLYPGNYGWDASIYMKMGKSIIDGYTPYVDIYEQKGPVIFFINALGQLLYFGRLGTFFVQIPFIILTVLGLYLLMRQFASRAGALLGTLFCLVIYSVTLEGGNLTEEYDLIFIILPLLLGCRLLLSEQKLRWYHGVIFGFCFAFVGWTRLNNAAAIGMLVLYLYLRLLFKKEYLEFFLQVLYFLSGFLIVTLPILAFFGSRNALFDLIDGSFLFSFYYARYGAVEKTANDWISIFWKVSPLLFAIVSSLFFALFKHRNCGMMICLSSALTALALIPGFGFYHYFSIMIPLFAIGLSMLWQMLSDKTMQTKRILLVLPLAGLIISSIHYFPQSYQQTLQLINKRSDRSYYGWVRAYSEQAKLIPEDERDEVWTYGTTMYWPYITDVNPSFKYFANQQSWSLFRPSIVAEMEEMLENDPPKWIACCDNDRIPLELLKEKLATEYELVDLSGEVYLYRRIEE